MAKLDIIGPLFSYTENDSRLIAQKFKEFKNDEPLEIFFHTPGGSIWEANAIFHMIRRHQGPTTAQVVLAMSSGSYLAMACDDMVVFDYSEFMIHRAMTIEMFIGNAVEIDPFIDHLKEQKDALGRQDKAIANIYGKRGGMEVGKVLDWMAATTTWRGNEIVKAGFATKFEATPARDKSKFVNFDLSCYKDGKESPWHQTFDDAIPARDSWAMVASQRMEAPDITAPTQSTADTTKLRELVVNKARARDRILNLKHHKAI